MGGGMEANKNRWIEDWSTARENLELNFRWTRRNLALVGIFGVAVPILVYKGIVKEFVVFLPHFLYDDIPWFSFYFIYLFRSGSGRALIE
ncbi:UNVERIFIED_CONTAM: hypothetical protein Sradi_5775000 [Sesamum radiatum]|uniref:Uncharacterized protein n=1 Tax=Sesamum radiatum TaxID=300843 RepID=A0AAW2KMY1_SESRA